MLSFTQPLKEMAEFEEIEKSMEKSRESYRLPAVWNPRKHISYMGFPKKLPGVL